MVFRSWEIWEIGRTWILRSLRCIQDFWHFLDSIFNAHIQMKFKKYNFWQPMLKNMKKHLIAASQNTEHPRLNGSRSLWNLNWPTMVWPIPERFGCSIHRSSITVGLPPWFVPDWGETLGIDLGPFSGSCWTGTPGIWIEIPVSAFCESKISEADLNILHLVSILYPCTVLWR